MTQDEIIELAVKAGFFDWEVVQQFETFAKLVEERAATKEREACAKICDGNIDPEYKTGKVDHNEIAWAQLCAIQIRKRGQE